MKNDRQSRIGFNCSQRIKISIISPVVMQQCLPINTPIDRCRFLPPKLGDKPQSNVVDNSTVMGATASSKTDFPKWNKEILIPCILFCFCKGQVYDDGHESHYVDMTSSDNRYSDLNLIP